MRVDTAIKMIENHGLKAFVTAEGLAVVCEYTDMNRLGLSADAELIGDCVFEEVTTFAVYDTLDQKPEHTYVDGKSLRNWLGY